MPSHAGQRVLITAAASGIGLVTAQAFAAAGARVYICDIDAAALAETLLRHPQLAGQVCDVANEAQGRRCSRPRCNTWAGWIFW